MTSSIPVSVIIVTRNEAQNISRCLSALADFEDVIVVDSGSTDGTATLAATYGARVVNFTWRGKYPKKRQWCLDHVETRFPHVFFVDADEVVTPALVDAIRRLRWDRDGYFVRGAYVFDGAPLRFGLTNNKLCLFDRRAFAFPVVNDLAAPGMGEMEGHYQPLPVRSSVQIGQIKPTLLHYSGDDGLRWQARHERYAAWEAYMLRQCAYPPEVGAVRTVCKYLFRHLPYRPAMAFIHSYVLKSGFLDGVRGWRFAKTRYDYYRMVNAALSSASIARADADAVPTARTAPQK